MDTREARLAVETRPARLALETNPLRFPDDTYPAVPRPMIEEVTFEFKSFVFKKVLVILIVTIPVPAAGDTLIFVPPTT